MRAALERSPVATWTSLTGSLGLSRVPSNAHWGSRGLQQCLWVSCKASSAVFFGTLFLEAQTRFRKKILQTFQQPCEAPNILLKRKRKIFSAPPASQLLLCLVKNPHCRNFVEKSRKGGREEGGKKCATLYSSNYKIDHRT